MMNNLYVFAIGGSGERVMKSLVMMLAAGMPIGAKKIIPVFVDNDIESKALTTCLDLINYYRSNPKTEQTLNVGLHYMCGTNKGDFGKVPSFAHVEIGEPVKLNVAGEKIGNLDKIIGSLDPRRNSYEDSANEEKNLLFTDDDLKMPLTVGFVGNPNIGSVVLNSLSMQGDAFNTIYGDAGSSDGVFVIGSLFGGTGAAGFPLIVNKFLSDDNTHCPLLGGVALLPYYNIAEGDKTKGKIDTTKYDVNSATFTSKTRAALMYYDEYMRDMHYMYYVGDSDKRSLYQHFVGGEKQENPYNMVEVMAALSVVNFSKKDTISKPADVVYHMPIWDFKNETLSNISSIRNKDLKEALVKFQIMKVMFENDEFIKWAVDETHPYVRDLKFDNTITKAIRNEDNGSSYAQAWGLRKFFKEWEKWLGELGDSKKVKRNFDLFNSSDGSITRENITEKFFSDNEHGIAKTKVKKILRGFPPHRVDVVEVISPKIEDAMLEAFNELKVNSSTTSRDKALSTLMLVISNALDKVLKDKCDL